MVRFDKVGVWVHEYFYITLYILFISLQYFEIK